jgi:pimeloyl-ACP methyl ester carboxylesterase
MLADMWRLSEASAARGEIVSDGFVLTRETIADVSLIDLAALETAPAGEVLIVSEAPSRADDRLAARLDKLGCRVTRKSFAGFAAAMDSATLARIPIADWGEVVSFLTKHRSDDRRDPTLPKRGAFVSTAAYREERMVFATGDRLAGVLCRPARGRASGTVVFVNTGGNPHLGWGRMSVEHARVLAARGIASLRMDIAGVGDAILLGDSPRAALYNEEGIANLYEALDLLETRGLTNFAVVGHCSGAWLAFNAALQDSRIQRLFLVNLQRFIWTGKENLETLMAQSYRATDSYLQEIGSGVIWRRVLKGGINWPRLPGIAASIVRRASARLGAKLWSIAARMTGIETETARITQMLARLSQRKADVLLVYSDTDPGRDELARHFGAAGCGLQLPRTRTAIIENADHDITSQEARAAYLDLLLIHLGQDKTGHAEVSPAQSLVAEAA